MTELNLLDYIIDGEKELEDFYYKIQNLFPVCLKCQKPTFLNNLKENKIVKIKIECPFCKNLETLTLKEYIEKLEALIPEKKYCKEHKDKLSYGFCQDCDIWLCKECFIGHLPENHDLYQSQFKIRPTCPEHPKEKASFYYPKENKYLCNKCNFKPILDQLTNAYFYNLQDDGILSHCYRCLNYDFIITEARKDLNNLDCLIDKILNGEDSKLAEEKSEQINTAYNLINKNIYEVRFNNLFIANSYLKSMPNYHVFKNIKNNMGENHTTFWGFNDMIYEIKDKEKDMTKETLLELIDKFIGICENNLTTGMHKKLSEEDMLDFPDESELRVVEIGSYKIDEKEICKGYLLEKGKSFIIHGIDYFIIYDSNTFGKILEKKFLQDGISYVSVIDNKRFLVSFDKHYEYYELKEGKYELTKTVEIQEVNLDEFKKEMGIEVKPKKEKKEKKNDDDEEDNDDESDEYDPDAPFHPKDINRNISAITLLKDETKVAVGQGSLISIREFNTGKLIKTLVKHEGGIEVLFTVHNYLVSSCLCNNLCFWNMDTLELEKCLDCGFKNPTGYVIIDDETMITGGDTGGNLIDLDILKDLGYYSGDFIMLEGLVQINDEEVLVATKDYSTSTNNFYLLDIYSMEIKLHMKNVHSDICEACIKIDDNRFVSLCRDCTFKVWNIKEKENKSDLDKDE